MKKKGLFTIILLVALTALFSQQSFANPFTNAATLTGLSYGSIAVGDLDNDGIPDLVMTGVSIANNFNTLIYKNNGNFTFTMKSSNVLPGVYRSSIALGDVDNDNFLDIIICGTNNGNKITKIFKNTGNFMFTEISQSLPGVMNGYLALGDLDNDSDLDLVLTGYNGPFSYMGKILLNDGAGHFLDYSSINYFDEGNVSIADMNNDGYFDIVSSCDAKMRIHINDKTAHFNLTRSNVPFWKGSMSVGDIAGGDGRIDIVATGYDTANPTTRIFQNTVGGTMRFFQELGRRLIVVLL